MKYEKPELTVFAPAINAIQATKDDIVTDSSVGPKDPSATTAYADWEE